MGKINIRFRIVFTLVLIILIPLVLAPNIKEMTFWSMGVIYIGVTLGGLLAVGIIYYQQKKNTLESTKELQLIYKPELKLGKTRNINNLCNRIKIFTSDDNYRDNNSRYGHYFLEIRNSGKGEMADIRLKDLKVKTDDDKVKTIGYFSNNDIVDSVEVNDSIVLSIGTPENLYNNDILTTYDISFVIEYRGILNSKLLKDKISFTVSNNNKNQSDIYNFKVENIL